MTTRARCDVIMGTDCRCFRWVRILDPTNYASDHYMVSAEINVSHQREHQAYLKGRKKVPETKIIGLDTDEADQRMTEVMEHCEKNWQETEVPRPDWISVATWGLMQERVRRYKSGTLTEAHRLILKRRIRSGLKLDRKRRAAAAGIEMERCVASGELVEAWQVAKRWYRGVTGRPPPPAREDMETTADVYHKLYTATTPYGGKP
jgi:hypothetical protein